MYFYKIKRVINNITYSIASIFFPFEIKKMNKSFIIGREKEIKILNETFNSYESELVSIIGRRRVGKTFLVQSIFDKKIDFEITGIQHAKMKEQLDNFTISLNLFAQTPLPASRPKNWLEAFRLLILYLESKGTKKKRVVFFDELPWLATHRSGFLNAFGFFWNSWAVKNNVLVIICGSAASWMIQKVVRNKGGLYNRITKRIRLNPFTLRETEQYLQKRKINFDKYQIIELYMAMGGIPHYLKEIQKGESVTQNIDRICFDAKGGPLYDEFDQLYPSLFDHSENHIAFVRALASKPSGLNRSELIKITGIANGGGISKTLEELIHSDFITEYFPFGKKKKDMRYRLTDEYSLFYIKFIEPLKKEGAGIWKNFQQSAAYHTWSGYSFENICLKHILQIKKALGISGIFSTHSTFYHRGAEGMGGCQIDLLIDRNDKAINVCEIKFTNAEFVISKKYAKDLRSKTALFKHYSKTKKQVFLTFITTFGLLENEHKGSIVDKELTLEVLFE